MKQRLETAVTQALNALGLPETAFVVEHPVQLSHGDYTCNVALVVAKAAKAAPREVAERIAPLLSSALPEIERIEVVGPGFINFFLVRSFFTTSLTNAFSLDTQWGRGSALAGKRYIVEYTDPNPFKEFHVGHLFTNAVGECIARLCMNAGADVKRVCYQGDVGLHVSHAIWGMQQLGISSDSNFSARDLGKAYAYGATAYKSEELAKGAIDALNKVIYERTDSGINALYDAGRKVSLAYFETIYARVDTHFDSYFFESEAAPEGKRIVLAHPNIFKESDGAYIFAGEEHGLHTRVFLNKLGLPTYEAKELALAKLKEDRLGNYDHSIISTAKEINEYFKVLKCAMGFVYPELAAKTEHVGHGMVRLSTGKMSSRTGEVITALDFINDVAASARERVTAAGVAEPTNETIDAIAIAAIKYTTLKGNITQDSVFDKESALSFEGNSGPYLQYTYARIQSLLEKAAAIDVVPKGEMVPEIPYPIERILYRFPAVLATAEAERAPHLVVTYLTEVASEFNSFYATEKIANPQDIYAPYKAQLAATVGKTLKNGLWVLGINAPERM